MTIADYCVTLLRQRSPRSLEELAKACIEAGTTKAQDPLASVKNSLLGRQEVAPRLPDGRYGFTLHLLEGRWLTTRARTRDRLSPSLDLHRLHSLLSRWPVAHLSGGSVTTSEYADGLAGPPGWLPNDPEALVGVRLVGGALETAAVDLDDLSVAQGKDLAARVRTRINRARSGWSSPTWGCEHGVWRVLVELIATDPDVLALPVPPLSDLLPEMVRRPEARVELGEPMSLRLPVELQSKLAHRAHRDGTPLDVWLLHNLERLADGYLPPRWEPDVYDEPWDDPRDGRPDDDLAVEGYAKQITWPPVWPRR